MAVSHELRITVEFTDEDASIADAWNLAGQIGEVVASLDHAEMVEIKAVTVEELDDDGD